MERKIKITRLVMALSCTILAWGILEGFAFFLYVYPQFGWVSARSALNSGAMELGDPKKCSWKADIVVHPHLSHIRIPIESCARSHAIESGFASHNIILFKKSDEAFNILVLGGSVAEFLSLFGPSYPLSSRFQSFLNQKFTGPRGETIRIINASIAAGSWPQQLNALNYFHEYVNAVLVLDGFNEMSHSMPPYRFGTPSFSLFEDLVNNQPSLFNWKSAAREFRAQLNESVWGHSYIALTIFFSMSENSKTTQKEIVAKSFGRLHTYHESKADRDILAENAKLYGDSIRQIHAFAKASALPSAHFMQPTAYFRKKLTAEELDRIKPSSFLAGYYALFQKEFRVALSQGLQGADLTGVFEHNDTTIYTDPIHYSIDGYGFSRGYEILMSAMAPHLQKAYGLKLRK